MKRKSVAFLDNNLKTELVVKEEKDQRESLEIVTEVKPRKSILKKKISKFYPTVEFTKDLLHQSSKDTRHIYINNQEKNKKKYNYQDNFIKTSKYNVLNFLPKALLSQFKRYANIYFLFIGIIQCIPQISPLNPSTAIAPFFLVLMISIVREGIEDYYKHVNDSKENKEKVLVFNGKNYCISLSKNLKVGDIVKVEEYGVIPADLLLLSTSNLNKMAYIETANLDGEKNLKPKFCIESTFRMFKEADEFVRIRGKIVCDKPNSDLNKFYGRLKLNSKTDISMSVKQLLYKGTILKNTKWVVGVVLYAGVESKIILNSQKGETKQSSLESKVNRLIALIFLIQIGLCLFLCSFTAIWTLIFNDKHFYLNITLPYHTTAFFSFFSFLLLLNTMIPISLIVTLEIVKYFQGLLMESDIEMYSSGKDKFVKVNSCSLNEELGQIKYIFSDKTGTLTANKLEFKACVIGDEIYGCTDGFLESEDTLKNLKRRVTHSIGGIGMKMEFTFPVNQINTLSVRRENGKEYDNISIPSNNGLCNFNIQYQRQIVEFFLLNLSINHSCFVDKIENPKGLNETQNVNVTLDHSQSSIKIDNVSEVEEVSNLNYKGENPDDITLVDAARHLGYAYNGGDDTKVKLKLRKYDKIQGKEILEDLQVKVLKTLEFSSARGMMSTIAKVNDKIYCFSKGSDKKIEALLYPKKQPFKNSVQTRARKLSEKGLRVMWVAIKILEEKEFIEWNESFEKNIQSFSSETEINNFKFERFQLLESNLTLIGCTAVEDKLQDYVPETIKEIQTAGINFWVLTGDNLPTARNIGIMCNLLVKNMKIYEIYDDINKFKSVITALYPEETIFSEESLEKAKLKIACFENKFKDVYSHIQSKEYNNKKGILLLGLEKMMEVYENSMKSDASSLTGILVESDILKIILPNEKYKDLVYYSHPLTKLFLDLTLNSQAVICCRVSPKQKALVVRMVKNNIKNAITLAIGDGANDVSMIMEASVGVGIYGEEGTQAAMSSDYAIGEFKCLRKLVLFHGRYNYLRIAEMIIYFFYKNFIFTIPQFYYAFETAFSGQTVFDEFFVALYNMSFTSFPLLFKALLEKDICFSSVKSSFVKNFIHDHLPYTFYVGRESITFSFRKFFKSIFYSIFQSIMIYYFTSSIMDLQIMSKEGFLSDLWVNSLTQFSAIISVVFIKLLVFQRHHTIYNMGITIVSILFYFFYFYVSSYLPFSKVYATVQVILTFPHFYLTIFLITGIAIMIDLSVLYYRTYFIDEPVNLIRRFIEDCNNVEDLNDLDKLSDEYTKKIVDFDKTFRATHKVERFKLD